jgi:hypothetical protein
MAQQAPLRTFADVVSGTAPQSDSHSPVKTAVGGLPSDQPPLSSYSPPKTFAEVVSGSPPQSVGLSQETSLAVASGLDAQPVSQSPLKTFAEVDSAVDPPTAHSTSKNVTKATPSPKLSAQACSTTGPQSTSHSPSVAFHPERSTSKEVVNNNPTCEASTNRLFGVSKAWKAVYTSLNVVGESPREAFPVSDAVQDSVLVTSFVGIPLFQSALITPESVAEAVSDPPNDYFQVFEVPMKPPRNGWRLAAAGLDQNGDTIEHSVEGEFIVAFTTNVFKETPQGRVWQIHSTSRLTFKSNGKPTGRDLSDKGKGLVKVSWEITGFDGFVYVFTALGLPGMTLDLKRAGAVERCSEVPGLKKESCRGCFMAEDGHWAGWIVVPLQDNDPPATQGPERWRLLKVPSVSDGDEIIAWHMRGYDEKILYTAVTGPLSMSHTASRSVTMGQGEGERYRSIVRARGNPQGSAGGREVTVAWELLDHSGSIHTFTVTGEPNMKVHIFKAKERHHPTGGSECTARSAYPAPRIHEKMAASSSDQEVRTDLMPNHSTKAKKSQIAWPPKSRRHTGKQRHEQGGNQRKQYQQQNRSVQQQNQMAFSSWVQQQTQQQNPPAQRKTWVELQDEWAQLQSEWAQHHTRQLQQHRQLGQLESRQQLHHWPQELQRLQQLHQQRQLEQEQILQQLHWPQELQRLQQLHQQRQLEQLRILQQLHHWPQEFQQLQQQRQLEQLQIFQQQHMPPGLENLQQIQRIQHWPQHRAQHDSPNLKHFRRRSS